LDAISFPEKYSHFYDKNGKTSFLWGQRVEIFINQTENNIFAEQNSLFENVAQMSFLVANLYHLGA
jgi:hypothetical protein